MNIPEGFVLVPVEPTRTQLVAGLGVNGIHPIYCAMVAAAPPVDLPSYDEAKERELFEAYALEILGDYFMKPEDCLTRSGGTYMYGQPATAWCAWQACAKSRARSAE